MGAELPFDSLDVSYLTAAVPHAIFVRVAWWITAFVTLERCLCIAMPLKIKQIITARRTIVINVVFFAGTLIGLCPIFLCRTLRPLFNSAKNRTIVVTVKPDGFFDIENIGFTFNVVSQFSAFIIDVVCTVTIIQILQMKSKWRSETASTSASGAKAGFESRDKKLIKMIAFISCIFIGCSMPSCLNYAVTVTMDEYTRDLRYHNVNRISWAVIVALEAINSSVNVFVYYNMSGKYRTAFNEMFFGKDSTPKLKAEKQ
ncbi:unnamed protein product [Lymnaea stagnalis]|uniref:G-protein coupled receptors family 1 profile domain-containing protein n=1 Tax=Lymnaea stagnalis TaxID=6523 RepID=A0AAV2GXL0_LYMST